MASRRERADGLLTVRFDEVRLGDRRGDTALLIVPSDGARAHGWEHPTLLIGDEVWAWSDRDPSLLGAMATSLIKNPSCRLLVISTAAASLDSPLGRMRERALAQPEVHRHGSTIDAHGDGLRWLEWSLPDDASPEDFRAVAACNPLPPPMRCASSTSASPNWSGCSFTAAGGASDAPAGCPSARGRHAAPTTPSPTTSR